jgi:transposase
MDKIDSRTLPVEALNERRRRAVKMRLDGVSLKQTPTQCELSRTTVIAAVKAFHEGGWKAVMVNPLAARRAPAAPQWPSKSAKSSAWIRDRTADQLKMVYALWMRQAVSELIRDRFGITLPVRTMGSVSEALGRHAAEADEQGLRTVAGGGEEVARRAVSGHRRVRQDRRGRDSLG